MLKGKSLRRADIVSGVVFVLLGIAVLIGASRMPIGGTYGGVDNPWYASPAAFPFLIGGLFVLCGLSVATNGIRKVGIAGLLGACKRAAQRSVREPTNRRGLSVLGLLCGYYILLRARWLGEPALSYTVSSSLFLVCFALLFFRPQNRFPKLWQSGAIVLGALAIAALVAHIFSERLGVPLP